MSDRKLFYALDKNGNRLFVDKLQDKNIDFFCPHCKAKVMPRMGEHNAWHFAHIGEVCKFLSKNDNSENKQLNGFSNKTITIDELKVSKPKDKYSCMICKSIGNISGAVKIKDNVYVCKECYLHNEEIKKII